MRSNQSVWKQLELPPQFPRLEHDLEVQVAVIGGGITGTTAALLLAEGGMGVAVIEANRLASGASGDTTGHLTQVLDERYYQLERDFGRDATRLIASSVAEAIDRIGAWAGRLEESCGFERVDGTLFTERRDQRHELGGEFEACLRAGLAVKLIEAPRLPFPVEAAFRVENQAQLSITPYLSGLAKRLTHSGGKIFEQTRVIELTDGEPCLLQTSSGRTVRAQKVIIATHSPLNRVFLQTKLARYQTYVVGGEAPVGSPSGLFWDMEDPYHYIRSVGVNGRRLMIIGGEDHKTGKGDPRDSFDRLAAYAMRFSVRPIHRWSHQVIETVDGLPYIGRNSGDQNVFVATGYSGTGLTFGTLAAMISSDLCLERPNRYAELYSATRIKPRASLGTFVKENVDYPVHLVTDTFRRGEVRSVEEIARGEGRVVRMKGTRLAVYRDSDGQLHTVSARCTHLGCVVGFNPVERSWDCACHGSRFDPDGKVIDGPAVSVLERKKLGE